MQPSAQDWPFDQCHSLPPIPLSLPSTPSPRVNPWKNQTLVSSLLSFQEAIGSQNANWISDRDNLANVYEAEKDHQLKDEKEGKAHWKQELASNSEASVWHFSSALNKIVCIVMLTCCRSRQTVMRWVIATRTPRRCRIVRRIFPTSRNLLMAVKWWVLVGWFLYYSFESGILFYGSLEDLVLFNLNG